MEKDVVREEDGTAKVVFNYYNDDKRLPVFLHDFETDASKSDFDIREEAYEYWKDLLYFSGKKAA
jgi:hypothetical protein